MSKKGMAGLANVILGLVVLLSFAGVPAESAQNGPAYIRMIRTMEADETGQSNPTGLAFSKRANSFSDVVEI